MTLVIGVGNPQRSDDGAGPAAARLVNACRPDLDVREVQQLTPELAEDMAAQDAVLFLDASVQADEVATCVVEPARTAPPSHACTPATLLALSQALYGRSPPRCAMVEIPARSFELGEALSPEVTSLLPIAAEQALAWLDA